MYVLKLLLGNWSVFYIYRKTLKPTSEAVDSYVVKRISSEKHQLHFRVADEFVCSLVMLWGEEYKKRNFIKLLSDEAKVISVETAKKHRGHGYAVRLLLASEAFAYSKNIKRLYARIWHSNKSSIKAFEKAGWVRHSTKVELKLFSVVPIKFTVGS